VTKAQLPINWRATRLGAIIDGFEAGRNLRAEGRPAAEGEYGVLKISAVSWGRFRAEENKALLAHDRPKPHEIVRRGDVLISRANTSELVGAVVLVEEDHPRLMLPDKVLRLQVRTNLVDARFLVQALRLPEVRAEFEANATGTSDSMRNLSQPKMEAAPVLLPPLNEQRRIVAKLEALQSRSRRAREALDAIPPLLEKLRQSILAAAFRGDLTAAWRAQNPNTETASVLLPRMRTERRKKWEEAELAKLKAKGKTPTDDKWKTKYAEPEAVDTKALPLLPDGWCWASVDELSILITSGSRGWAEYYASSGPLFIRSQDINSDALRLDDVAHVQLPGESEGSRTSAQAFDVLITITGANVTRCAPVRATLGEAYVSQHVALVRPVDSSITELAHLWLISEQGGRKQLKTAAYGLGKPGLNLADVANVYLPLPPAAERAQIVQRAATLLDAVSTTATRLASVWERLGVLDAAALAKAFRGELVPQDPNDEPVDQALIRPTADLTGAARKPGRVRQRKMPEARGARHEET
jgi:type I restriction enzyme S subunit